MERLPNWDAALAAYLAERESWPFAYGVHDCAMFAAGAVRAMRGVDPAEAFRNRYRTRAGSLKILRTVGEGTLEKTFDARFPFVPPGYARRGDLVWNGESVGVCFNGDGLFVPLDEDGQGYVRLPRETWRKAWAV